MPQVSDIGVEDMVEDNEEDNDETLPAVFTLSASYIGLPGFVIDAIFAKSFSKFANCTVNNKTLYVECSTSSKKNMEKILERNLYFGFQGPNMMVSLKDLLLRNEHSKKATFNIKRTYNNRIILGEPIYDNYVLLLDYTKNRIGFAPKRVNFSEFFVNVVTLVRFLCLIFVLGTSFATQGAPSSSATSLAGSACGRWRTGSSSRRAWDLRGSDCVSTHPFRRTPTRT
jgi:hypothetical protein